MNVRDVGEEYAQTLSRQKQILRKAQAHQGRRPRDWKSKDEMYMGFMMAIMANDLRKQGDYRVYTSFVPPAYPPCITPLAELRRASIRDLRLETHHRGTYLMVRVITPPNRMTGIMVLVEDESEHAIMLQIYQQNDEATRTTKKIVNTGTVMIIKEPFFKVMASGEYGLRVDHLSDTIEINEYDPRRPVQWRSQILDAQISAAMLKDRGNEAVGEGKYWRAITQ
jgi:hypothetical protein